MSERATLRRRAIFDQELIELAVVVDRRLDVLRIDLVALIDGPGNLVSCEEIGNDVTVVAVAHDRVSECVTASLEHLRDQTVELRERLAGRRLHVVVELLPPAFPEMLVETGFEHSPPTFAIEEAFKPVKRAR